MAADLITAAATSSSSGAGKGGADAEAEAAAAYYSEVQQGVTWQEGETATSTCEVLRMRVQALTWAGQAKDAAIEFLKEELRKECAAGAGLQRELREAREREERLRRELAATCDQLARAQLAEESLAAQIADVEAEAAEQAALHKHLAASLSADLRLKDERLRAVEKSFIFARESLACRLENVSKSLHDLEQHHHQAGTTLTPINPTTPPTTTNTTTTTTTTYSTPPPPPPPPPSTTSSPLLLKDTNNTSRSFSFNSSRFLPKKMKDPTTKSPQKADPNASTSSSSSKSYHTHRSQQPTSHAHTHFLDPQPLLVRASSHHHQRNLLFPLKLCDVGLYLKHLLH